MSGQINPRTSVCVLAVAASCLFAKHSTGGIDHLVGMVGYSVPVFTILALRFSVFGAIQMTSVFSAFVIAETGLVVSDWLHQMQLAFFAIVTLAATFRFQAGREFASNRAVRGRLDHQPVTRFIPQHTFGSGHVHTIGFWVIGWVLAGFLCSHFTILTGSRRLYAEYRRMIDIQFGLIPEWYIGMKLFLSMALILGAASFVLAYMRLQYSQTNEANLLLRSEIWKWNGREQRRVSRANRSRRFVSGVEDSFRLHRVNEGQRK